MVSDSGSVSSSKLQAFLGISKSARGWERRGSWGAGMGQPHRSPPVRARPHPGHGVELCSAVTQQVPAVRAQSAGWARRLGSVPYCKVALGQGACGSHIFPRGRGGQGDAVGLGSQEAALSCRASLACVRTPSEPSAAALSLLGLGQQRPRPLLARDAGAPAHRLSGQQGPAERLPHRCVAGPSCGLRWAWWREERAPPRLSTSPKHPSPNLHAPNQRLPPTPGRYCWGKGSHGWACPRTFRNRRRLWSCGGLSFCRGKSPAAPRVTSP